MLILISALPDYFTQSARTAVEVCLKSVIPSLFCFIVLTKLIVSSGLVYLISKPFGMVFYKAFGLPPFSFGVYLLSFISGFPSGVIAATDLYKSGFLTKDDTSLLVAISNNTGPALPVLLIGVGCFEDARVGVRIYLIQLFSSLICAFIMRKRQSVGYEPIYPEMKWGGLSAVTDAVEGTVKSTAVLCGYGIFFNAVTDALSLLDLGNALTYIKPFIEIVSGSRAAAGLGDAYAFICVCSAVSFGGLCVHLQAASVCSRHKLDLSLHFKLKRLQALLAGIFASVYVIVLG